MFIKNWKINLQLWICLIIINAILIILALTLSDINCYLIISLIVINIIYVPVILFLPHIGLLYFITVTEDGLYVRFCNKIIKTIYWKDINYINKQNYNRSGLYLHIYLNNNKHLLIASSKKLEEKINNFIKINKVN